MNNFINGLNQNVKVVLSYNKPLPFTFLMMDKKKYHFSEKSRSMWVRRGMLSIFSHYFLPLSEE